MQSMHSFGNLCSGFKLHKKVGILDGENVGYNDGKFLGNLLGFLEGKKDGGELGKYVGYLLEGYIVGNLLGRLDGNVVEVKPVGILLNGVFVNFS